MLSAKGPSVYPDTSPPAGRTPSECGWLLWDQLRADPAPVPQMLVPRTAECSMPACEQPAIAAVQRSRSGSRPGFWQPYCSSHSHDRGVELVDGALVWTREFRDPAGHGTRAAAERRSSTGSPRSAAR